MSERLQKPIQWQHIHGRGIGAVVMDMDSKQLSGTVLFNKQESNKYIANIFIMY